LTNDLGGYYTTSPPEKDQFGAKGDFVTSPEISQVFGELIGVWVVAEWIAQGRKSEGVYLMEVGPGRGTLMDDMLRTIRNFSPLAKALEAVYMVEASPSLRTAQHKLLCGENKLEETELGWQSVSKHSPDLKIVWTEDIRFVPKEASKTPFIIAHEFFDAPTSPTEVKRKFHQATLAQCELNGNKTPKE
jgi:SAM-dependent MidA family methyltransferase